MCILFAFEAKSSHSVELFCKTETEVNRREFSSKEGISAGRPHDLSDACNDRDLDSERSSHFDLSYHRDMISSLLRLVSNG